MSSDADGPKVGVVMPIRSFSDANTRLHPTLDAPTRAALAQTMAEQVLQAVDSYVVAIVTGADEVISWANRQKTSGQIVVVDDPGTGLNGAADAGRAVLRTLDCGRIVIVHADLPQAKSLAPVLQGTGPNTVTLVPCHREDGTNVVSVPATAEFRFAYGPGSFRRHLAEAQRLDLDVRVARPSDLTADVDLPEDLRFLDPTHLDPGLITTES